MIKLILMMIFFLAGSYPLKADDQSGGEQEFKNELDNIKNPFEDGIPKPVVVEEPVIHHDEPVSVIAKPKPVIIAPPVIKLPALKVEGVIVGEGIYQAIIDDQVVPLFGAIKGVKVISVTKQGVGLLYRGKKFFLNVD